MHFTYFFTPFGPYFFPVFRQSLILPPGGGGGTPTYHVTIRAAQVGTFFTNGKSLSGYLFQEKKPLVSEWVSELLIVQTFELLNN